MTISFQSITIALIGWLILFAASRINRSLKRHFPSVAAALSFIGLYHLTEALKAWWKAPQTVSERQNVLSQAESLQSSVLAGSSLWYLLFILGVIIIYYIGRLISSYNRNANRS